ncbi:ATPase, AAA family protein [Besnoitia besnoiti]|uniref:Origin recognition complex subunit 1 n=1 Tax=Besnoitia besnoiti TaxID=94643 RepID=A0A2A9M638_BESBE|nr:ATPase, AAA family protein [Besnoitia besnoiti]PFH33409.1 ATPase, AAA family protein [Besnoitia besnoiti]
MPPPPRRCSRASAEEVAASSPLPTRASTRLLSQKSSPSPPVSPRRSAVASSPSSSSSSSSSAASSSLRRSPRKRKDAPSPRKRKDAPSPRKRQASEPATASHRRRRESSDGGGGSSSSFSENEEISSEEGSSSDSFAEEAFSSEASSVSDSESESEDRKQRRRRGKSSSASRQKSANQSSSSRSGKAAKTSRAASKRAAEPEEEEDDGWLDCERSAEDFVCEVPILAGEKTRKFFRKIVVTERHKTNKLVDGRKTEVNLLQYVEVAVADLERETGKRPGSKRGANAEFRNRTAQVMAIFQDFPVHEKSHKGGRRRKQEAGQIMAELRWLYDREDIENHCWWMSVSVSDADLPQETWEVADSDKCEILPADLIDEVVVAHYDRESFSAFFEEEERKEREKERRRNGVDANGEGRKKTQEEEESSDDEEEAVASVILVTHFFCTKTSAILPLSTMDPDSFFQKLQRCSRFYLRHYEASSAERDALQKNKFPGAFGKEGKDGKCDETLHRELVQRAVRRLQLGNIPDTLPCRGKECQHVRQFIRSSILQSGNGEVLYVSGLPGTGKTATVQSVLRELQEEVEEGLLPPFDIADVNAMRLPHPDFLFSVLHRRFFGTKARSTQQAFAALDRYFTSARGRLEAKADRRRDCDALEDDYWSYCDSRGRQKGSRSQSDWAKRIVRGGQERRPCVLVVDEVDCLLTQKQRVLYTLFDWPMHRNARLIVVGIANTVDLPDRILSSRCASRVGFGRLTFNPYTREQIEEILLARLQECRHLFNEAAIKVCARKVANFFGDLRRALQPADIAKAANDLFDSPIKDAITALPWGLKLLLFSLLQAQRVDGGGVPLLQLHNRFQGLLVTGFGSRAEDGEATASESPAESRGEDFRRALSAGKGIEFDELKRMIDVLVQLNVVRLGFYLPRVEAASAAPAADLEEDPVGAGDERRGASSRSASPQKLRKTAKNAALASALGLPQGFGPLRVDPLVDELGGDMQVAIAVPLEDVSSAFLEDPDFRLLL